MYLSLALVPGTDLSPEEEAFEVNKNQDEVETEKETKIAEENIIHAPRTIRINL